VTGTHSGGGGGWKKGRGYWTLYWAEKESQLGVEEEGDRFTFPNRKESVQRGRSPVGISSPGSSLEGGETR